MTQATSSFVLHCPACRKPILSQVALAEGSRFVVKCPNPECKKFVKVITGFNTIDKKAVENLHDPAIVTFTAE